MLKFWVQGDGKGNWLASVSSNGAILSSKSFKDEPSAQRWARQEMASLEYYYQNVLYS